MSLRFGTFFNVYSPFETNVAIIIGRAAFLAPLTLITPFKGVFPLILNPSTTFFSS